MIGIASTIGATLAAMHGGIASQGDVLTIDEAVRIAESNAFAVRIQKSVIEKNRQKVAEARGNLGPQISFGSTYIRYDKELTTSFGPGTPPVTIQPIDNKTANLTMTWPLDIAGNRTRLMKASEAIKRASDLALHGTYSDTKLNVRQAYISVLRTQAITVVDEQALTDAKERLDQAQKQFDQQQVAKLDVTRFQAQVAQAQSDLIAANDNLTLAKYTLNLALARPIETQVKVADINVMPSVPNSETNLVKSAQEGRPEVVSAKQTIQALSLITRATESGMNPSLNLQVQYQRTIDAQGFSSRSQSTTGTLLLNIPIFDSGVTRARVRQARQDEVQAKISLEQTELNISQEVRNAIANLTSAKARLANANEQVKLAEEVYRLAKVKQDAGAGTYYEVVDAESQLTLARNGRVSARYDYLNSFSQLQRAVGQDDVESAANNAGTPPTGGK